jgi:hypothetical protein
MWRSYRKFWRNRQADGSSTQVHLFVGIHEYPEYGTRTALCGKVAAADDIAPMLVGPLQHGHYCKKCEAILAKQQG